MGGAVESSGILSPDKDLAEGAGENAPLKPNENFERRPHRSPRVRALFGDDFEVRSEVGHILAHCRHERALLSWITPGAYAWWMIHGTLKARQRLLVEFRAERAAL